jgi:hypothetical protein
MYRYNQWISGSLAQHNMSELDRYTAARNHATGIDQASDSNRRPNPVGVMSIIVHGTPTKPSPSRGPPPSRRRNSQAKTSAKRLGYLCTTASGTKPGS